jgi:hypothetical protein
LLGRVLRNAQRLGDLGKREVFPQAPDDELTIFLRQASNGGDEFLRIGDTVRDCERDKKQRIDDYFSNKPSPEDKEHLKRIQSTPPRAGE